MARPALKRRDIEEAAIELFASKGLARTTIRDIAERAGVTEGALYRHYSGKSEMALSLFTREVEKFAREFEGVLFEGSRPLAERLKAAVEYIYRYYRDHPVRFTFILLTQHGFPAETTLDETANPTGMAIRFVRGEMDRRTVSVEDPVLTAALLMGAVLQPVFMHRYGRIKVEPLSFAGDVADALEAMLTRKASQGASQVFGDT